MKEEDTITDYFEEIYPNLSQEFKAIQQEQYILFSKKMVSYGIENIALGTTLEDIEDVNISLKGVLIRVLDKVSRLKNLIFKQIKDPIKDESIQDTWIDIGNYAIIALLLIRRKWKK